MSKWNAGSLNEKNKACIVFSRSEWNNNNDILEEGSFNFIVWIYVWDVKNRIELFTQFQSTTWSWRYHILCSMPNTVFRFPGFLSLCIVTLGGTYKITSNLMSFSRQSQNTVHCALLQSFLFLLWGVKKANNCEFVGYLWSKHTWCCLRMNNHSPISRSHLRSDSDPLCQRWQTVVCTVQPEKPKQSWT